jgi:hypothetical protein
MSKQIDHFILRDQTDDDSGLLAGMGTDAVLHGLQLLEGELVRADTVAASYPGSGRRCVDLQAAALVHHPGLLAEMVSFDLLLEATGSFCASAERRDDHEYWDAHARLLQEAGAGNAPVLPGDATAIIERSVTHALYEVASGTLDAVSAVQFFQDADVSEVAAQATAPSIHRFRSLTQKTGRDAHQYLRQGRLSQARAGSEASVDWLTEHIAAMQRLAEDAEERVRDAVSAINGRIAEMPDDGRAPRRGRFTRFLSWWESLLETHDGGEQQPGGDPDLIGDLRRLLRARMERAAATRLQTSLAAMMTAAVLRDDDLHRTLLPVRALAARAAAARLELVEMCRERGRRLRGAFLPEVADVRAVVRTRIGISGQALASRILLEPLQPLVEAGRRIDPDEFAARALTAARTLTEDIRQASLGQLLDVLPDTQIESFARLLAALEPTLQFRAGHPIPATFRRVAVPGGPQGRLGAAVLRRYNGVTVVPIDEPLLAFGVAITDVFAVTELEAYRTTWRAARETARREGWHKRLVSDRRLLDLDDGITTDEELDRIVIKGIACDVLAPSKEPPAAPSASGTWYVMPDGQEQRPSQIDPVRLDGIFNGNRLGRSLREMRQSLRHSPAHREFITQRWQTWADDVGMDAQVARFDTVIHGGLLPSDELVPVCRQLKTGVLQHIRRIRYEVN